MLPALALLALAVVGGCVLIVAKLGWMGLLLTPLVVYAAVRIGGLVSPALFGHWVYAGLQQATRPMSGASVCVNEARPIARRWEPIAPDDRAESGAPRVASRDEHEQCEWRLFDLTIAPTAGDEVEWEPEMIGLYSSPGPAARTAAEAYNRLCEVTRHEVLTEGRWEEVGNRKFRGELRVRLTCAVPVACRRFGLIYALTMLVNDFEEPSRPVEAVLS